MTEPVSQHPYTVIAAVDMSESSERVLMRAFELAQGHGPVEVHVLCVVAIPDSPFSLSPTAGTVPPNAVQALRDYVAEKLGVYEKNHPNHRIGKIQTHVLVGAPADEIIWLAAHTNADIAVLGTHGRRGVKRIVLGSVAEKVSRNIGCPIVVERQKEHNKEWMIPEIEPLCPDCAATRKETGGKDLWCKRHHEHHARVSIHPAFGGGTGDFRAI